MLHDVEVDDYLSRDQTRLWDLARELQLTEIGQAPLNRRSQLLQSTFLLLSYKSLS